ncbi:MAG TPA: PepSY-associated TM helix domain-containing protein [Solirubrobacteraceae bacterium]|jgi:uncharacterized iron-regulated membrane protein|nr:PepSY-associated TM helix domain-containing protein [Solirubrobacteraceae bacterium]
MATIDTPPVDDVAFVGDQIAEQDQREAAGDDDAGRRRAKRSQTLRPLLWRLHFIGGFLAGPVVISLALTGILFAWYPQVDGLRFGGVVKPSSAQVNVSLADQVEAAQATHPDWGVHSVVPGHAVPGSNDLNTAVVMDPPGGEQGVGKPADAVDVYVDQATGKVTGDVTEANDSNTLFRGLHSNWLLGDGPRPLTELAGAWFLVSLMTGLYLWWPGLRKRGTAAFAFRRRMRGRRQSKDWHNFIGIALIVPMFFVVVTGLTWTKYSGARYDQIKTSVFSAPTTGGPNTARASAALGSSALKNIDVVNARAREADLPSPVRITLPADDKTGWQATSERQRFPMNRDAIVVDGATGAVVDRYFWSHEHWFSKLTSAGISFHQGELFGVPLQIFMTLLAIGVIALVVFGYKMWWQRRPLAGMGSPPPIRAWVRHAPVSMLVVVLVLAWLLPTLGLSLLVWLVIERALLWTQIARGKQKTVGAGSRLAKYDTPLKPGFEAYKAVVVAVLGLAMVLAPHIGDANEDLTTIPKLLAWAWSTPLGVVFVAAGSIGMYAMYMTSGKTARDDTPVTA